MPQSQTAVEAIPHAPMVKRPLCEHRVDVVCVKGKFILDLWECRYCGQRIRRKKFVDNRPTGV
jgi:hypothetical protein